MSHLDESADTWPRLSLSISRCLTHPYASAPPTNGWHVTYTKMAFRSKSSKLRCSDRCADCSVPPALLVCRLSDR